MSEILVAAEVAPMLRTTPQGLAQLRYLGKGPKFIKRGARVLYRRSDIEDYLTANTRTSTGEHSGAA
ncbi:helix-turn-helix transcriptional regulator [Nocardia sp. NPDC059180]|uniref:helix-turn-helix transcriptional regulator n=1 Tax=Nocardia sp. NPDC059180 TaxID=3346761 RepID=UPI00368E46C0